jgi:peptidoglycan/LPS O-acetylase OafA/YrhL
VLAVVAFHALPNWVGGGFIGVDIFFVISGYLVSTIIFENLASGTFSFTEFYARRIKRIFPSLILVMASCLFFGWFVLLADELNQLGKHVAGGAAFISNFILWGEAGYFDNASDTKPLLHLWSLGVEEQFYIVWPLLLWFAWKENFNLLIITAVIAMASFILNLKGVKQDMVATFYSLPSRFWELLGGSLLAWCALYKRDAFNGIKDKLDAFFHGIFYSVKKIGDAQILINILSFVGFCLLLYGFWLINNELSFPGKWSLVPVLGTVLIISAGPKAWVNDKILSHRFAVWFGLISFPLYLWHWPLLSFARIVEGGVPTLNVRLTAVGLSILLAWLTVIFVEKPIRQGVSIGKLKIATLCILLLSIGFSGFMVAKADFTLSHGYEKLAIKRKGFEHAFGSSLNFYRGKDDWLFLGNAYQDTVAKLKLAMIPPEGEVEATAEMFSKVAATAAQSNTKVVLIVGPNKSSIYPEHLPDELIPSAKKYSSYFIDKLKGVPNLIVYNPTDDLLRLKNSEGILYWMTDTHWNNKGAFLAYSGFSKLMGLPVPEVGFQHGAPKRGDLIDISKLEAFPLHSEDNWDVVWKDKPDWKESESVVTNKNPLTDKYIWVVGDSFSMALRPYLNATFKEVYFLGNWDKLNDLPIDLKGAKRKPDIIIIVRVERSF